MGKILSLDIVSYETNQIFTFAQGEGQISLYQDQMAEYNEFYMFLTKSCWKRKLDGQS